ncbi:MAG: VOC family protein [Ardenticatenaceae bacterium]|nr:VOC family protein [Ardenticatenaceae bacterium]
MKIEHVAIWTQQLEALRTFYETYFHGRSSAKYTNARTGFQSYFVTFAGGARLELMQRADIAPRADSAEQMGLAHLAMSVGDETAVNQLTERLRNDGYRVVGEPRTTGDGYYESVILDPDGNRIEITK